MCRRNTFILFFLLLPGAARSSLSLNEIMASNVTAHADPRGQYEDWIEIHNRGEAEVDLAGYYIVDDWPDKALWQIPAGQAHRTTVPAGGYRLLYADGEPEAGADHLPFRLSKDGEQVVLIAADGTSLVDSLVFPQQLRDVSYGRPSNDISRGYMPEATPGAANGHGFSTFVRPPRNSPGQRHVRRCSGGLSAAGSLRRSSALHPGRLRSHRLFSPLQRTSLTNPDGGFQGPFLCRRRPAQHRGGADIPCRHRPRLAGHGRSRPIRPICTIPNVESW